MDKQERILQGAAKALNAEVRRQDARDKAAVQERASKTCVVLPHMGVIDQRSQ